jgi:hypothetical protein
MRARDCDHVSWFLICTKQGVKPNGVNAMTVTMQKKHSHEALQIEMK